MKPRFQADADLNIDIVTGIRRREPLLDFGSAQDLILEGADDSRVLEIAAVEGRILVSHDVTTMPGHFWRFLERKNESPGLFLVSQTTPISECIEEILLIWAASEAEEWTNRLTFLPL